jgi:putative radical SAM enzyme (TIGR03279 family)
MSVVRGPQAIVSGVRSGSIAADLGIRAGDRVVEVNGRTLVDNLDLQFAASGSELTLLVERGTERTLFEIDKDPEDDLGLAFDEELFDGIRRCKNNCVFCFVYQNPRGLRKSLYIKDEDFRYSFMYGNYMTLTNLSTDEMQRIVDQRMSPIYVSVHATDQAVRDMLLGRPDTPPLAPRLEFLTRHGIDFYAQLVLCPGLNDGPVLDRTLRDLEAYHPRLRGITGVPVGLTRYRDHLFPLVPYDRDGARRIIELAHARQEEYLERLGTRLLFLADEFYLIGEVPFPPPSHYERFETREDGVGMIPRFLDGLRRALPRFRRRPPADRRALIVTGRAAEAMFRDSAIPMMTAAGWPAPLLHPITNQFFGPLVNVAGLLTGRDLRAGLRFAPRADFALFCDYALKTGTDLFLDDLTVQDLERELALSIVPVTDSPQDLLHVIRDGKRSRHRRTRSGWEAEVARDGLDRYHEPLDPDPARLVPLFNRPSRIWPAAKRAAGAAASGGGAPDGCCGAPDGPPDATGGRGGGSRDLDRE